MRTLLPPPADVLDPQTRAPRVGSYRGGLPLVDLTPLAPGRLDRVRRHKRWLYVAIATDELWIAAAVVHLGYVANVFAFALDRAGPRMLVDRKALGLPFGVHLSDAAGERSHARARLPGARVRLDWPRGETAAALEVVLPGLEVYALLDARGAPPPISAIAALGDGSVNATEKRALLSVKGEARIAGRRTSLDGALAGYDYTNGLLPRRTRWKWAFALGRARTGERVALNLVEGFVGEPECALWVDGDLFPLAEGRISFDPERPLEAWRVRTDDGAVDLVFTPGGAHADRTNLGFIVSKFLQPAGVYDGTVRLQDGRTLELDRVLGVTEDQDVLW